MSVVPTSSETTDGARPTSRPRVDVQGRRTRAKPEPLEGGVRVQPVGPFVSILRRPILAVLPILLVLLPGLYIATQRTPEYTAEAQVLVGRVDVEANAVPGFVSATQQLAATYARLVSTTVMVDRVAEAVQLPRRQVSGHLSASPVPESSLIRIQATAGSEARSVALAEAASTELIRYLQETNESPAQTKALLDEYGAASTELQRAQLSRGDAEALLERASPAQVPARQATVAAARAAVDRAQLRANQAASAYTDSQRGAADRGTLQLVDEARSLGNDRSRRLQMVVAGSLVLGGLLGIGLASLRENKVVLRDLRRRVATA